MFEGRTRLGGRVKVSTRNNIEANPFHCSLNSYPLNPWPVNEPLRFQGGGHKSKYDRIYETTRIGIDVREIIKGKFER